MLVFCGVLLKRTLPHRNRVKCLHPKSEIEAIQSVKPQPERKFPGHLSHRSGWICRCAVAEQEKFHDDNGEFLEPLKGRGSAVVSRSRSNYPVTIVSLASMLNLEYASDLPIKFRRTRKIRKVFIQLIRANAVSRFLREKGYEVIHFKTDWAGTSSNLYATRGGHCFEGAGLGNGSKFFLAWQHSTILRVFNRSFYRVRVADPSADAFECMFTKLEESRRIIGSSTCLPSSCCQHPPYVFEEDGSRREYSMSGQRDWRPEVEYWAQLKYLNKRVSGIVDAILAEQGYDPIIILHSDHGRAFKGNAYSAEIFDEMLQERFSNLMAIRLPQSMEGLVYDGITQVNVFRLIFNEFTDGRFRVLPDKSYFVDADTSLFDYQDVTDEIVSRMR